MLPSSRGTPSPAIKADRARRGQPVSKACSTRTSFGEGTSIFKPRFFQRIPFHALRGIYTYNLSQPTTSSYNDRVISGKSSQTLDATGCQPAATDRSSTRETRLPPRPVEARVTGPLKDRVVVRFDGHAMVYKKLQAADGISNTMELNLAVSIHPAIPIYLLRRFVNSS